jgi:isoquinoline 1-oxidoreductase subunit alpha
VSAINNAKSLTADIAICSWRMAWYASMKTVQARRKKLPPYLSAVPIWRPRMTKLNINGSDVEISSGPDTPLLWVVRDELKLTGAKFGCGAAQCGACTMFADGQPVRSCVTPVSAVARQKILTPEGLSGIVADAVRAAWQNHDVAQCGYCQSGQIMAAVALLTETREPDDAAINAAMAPYLCRCATYARIRPAIKSASVALRA